MQANKEVKKLYYSIGEVSEITSLKQYVLRYWETEFVQLKPAKNSAGNRNYRKSDIDLILEIKDLLYKRHFTIKGAKQYLKDKVNHPVKKKEINSDQIKNFKEKVIKLTAADLKTFKQIQKGLKDLLDLIEELK